MEHIVQFAIGIDDGAIRKRIENHAYNEIVSDIKALCLKDLPRKWSYTEDEINWKDVSYKAVTELIEENKDDIIEEVVKRITTHIKRTKVFKDNINNAVEEIENE